MLTTNRLLEEKLTLFWHGHFATGDNKVRDYRMMLRQNEMLRAHASGNLRDLLIGILKDPAMLVYPDNGENIKKHPNENFCRELLELFTMGVGNYTERDVTERPFSDAPRQSRTRRPTRQRQDRTTSLVVAPRPATATSSTNHHPA